MSFSVFREKLNHEIVIIRPLAKVYTLKLSKILHLLSVYARIVLNDPYGSRG